jgi:nitrilase
VREERQNFDVMGHYARPDVLQLTVNRERQRAARFSDDA